MSSLGADAAVPRPQAGRSRVRETVFAAVAVAALGAAGAAWLRPDARTTSSTPVAQFEVPMPGDVAFDGIRLSMSPDGRWLAIYSANNHWLRSTADGTTMLIAQGQRVGAPRRLFDTDLVPSNQTEQFRVTSDGQRFLMLEPESSSPPLRVIVNWRERFRTANGQ
jgi:hypothetical protein